MGPPRRPVVPQTFGATHVGCDRSELCLPSLHFISLKRLSTYATLRVNSATHVNTPVCAAALQGHLLYQQAALQGHLLYQQAAAAKVYKV
jgi:hypothetical protein